MYYQNKENEMTITIKQIEKMKNSLIKAIKEQKVFIEHFSNGGKVEDFKPQETRKVVRPEIKNKNKERE